MSHACVLLLTLSIVLVTSAPLRAAELRRLDRCSSSPNCVCSETGEQSVAPLDAGRDPIRTWGLLADCIRELGGEIVQTDAAYMHALFHSQLFGFVDDLECRLDGSVIQVRSAARSGWWDLGVNRRRVERLRTLLVQRLAP